MRKKCVRPTKFVLACLIAVVAAQMAGVTTAAQSSNPPDLPRLQFADLQYVGGFRLPAEVTNGASFSFGGKQLAFNPASNSLFVGGSGGRVAEVSIPGAVNSANVTAMPFAKYRQPFADPTEGRLGEIGSEGVSIDSLMVYGNRLYGSAFIYYDAWNEQRASHFSHSLELNQPSFQGWSPVWRADRSGYVAGTMAPVPSEWQALLGGPALTGQCCIPIITRTSWGPSAFAFDPSKIGQGLVSALPLLYYTKEHATLGNWDAAGSVYGATMSLGGLVVVPGTRTALYFGAIGSGRNCYGDGTSDPALDGKIAADGAEYCYDPTSSDKGSHAYPYQYQIWAYDLAELAAVKAGTMQPWDVKPYGVWPLELPTLTAPSTKVKLGGATYDPATQTIYLSQMYGDQDGYAYRPVIHTFHVAAGTPPADAPAVQTVSVNADRPSPQTAGTAIRFTAIANGGGPVTEYKWLTLEGGAWTMRADWSQNSELVYTPAAADSGFKVQVWARNGETRPEQPEATGSIDFPVTSTRVATVAMAADKNAPQAPGTAITWTATASGGAAPQYKWWVFDGSTWTMVSDWSASNSYLWTPATAGSNYRVSVWSRSAGSTEIYEAFTDTSFAITSPIITADVARTVSMRASVPSPQPAGTAITFTAAANGVGSPHYKWRLFDGTNWITMQDWSEANTFQWTPAAAGSNYRVSVWTRSATSTMNYQAAAEEAFTITAPAPATKVSRVSLAPNIASPQAANTQIVWTATTEGGSAPQYKWWLYNGSAWTLVSDWSASNRFVWTPTVATPNYRVSVWARSGGSTEYYEAITEQYFEITAPVAAPRVTAVSMTANVAPPQVTNTAITWTAVATGAPAAHYKWMLFDGTTWSIARDWSSSNSYLWTPVAANANYRVAVWARSATSTEASEATAESGFAITAPAPPSRVSKVSLAPNVASPQAANSQITWTATTVGGVAPQYKWWLYNGSEWTLVSDWSASNRFVWTPTVAAPNYRVSVWARTGGSTEYYEAITEQYFEITAPVAAPRVTAVTMTANAAPPQVTNTAITWTAAATGAPTPHYKWLVFDGTTWSIARDWSSSNTYQWTPVAANANYRVAVWSRSATSTEASEATAESNFAVTAPVASGRVSKVSLASNIASPQAVNTQITWTATTVGGVAPQYKWWLYNGSEWTLVSDWSTSNRFVWTPAVSSPNYRVSVWARTGGSTEYYEAITEQYFEITAPVLVVSRVSSVTLSSNLAAPQRANTQVTFTAKATGGAGPIEYQFWVNDGSAWIPYGWSTSNTFTWTPSVARPNYRISVWARSAGNSEIYEALTETYFEIVER